MSGVIGSRGWMSLAATTTRSCPLFCERAVNTTPKAKAGSAGGDRISVQIADKDIERDLAQPGTRRRAFEERVIGPGHRRGYRGDIGQGPKVVWGDQQHAHDEGTLDGSEHDCIDE